MSDTLRQAQAMVREWQNIFDEVKPEARPTNPEDLGDVVNDLRGGLIHEESLELDIALFNNDLVEVADALGDLLYVVLGAFNTYGIDASSIFDEVHRTNMAKRGGKRLPTGKWEKPAGWKPPQIEAILVAQGWVGKKDGG